MGHYYFSHINFNLLSAPAPRQALAAAREGAFDLPARHRIFILVESMWFGAKK